MKRMLLSNDDGIHAEGMRCLHQAVEDLGTISVVAPGEEQSAVGHAITIFDPIKVSPVHRDGALFGHAVHGTPADCVKLAVCELLDPPPELVLSGINLGPNNGISVIYSGTVSAATEGCILGLPALAFSLCTFKDPHWDTAARVTRHLVKKLLAGPPLPEGCYLNVNIPNLPFDQLGGFRITHMARSRYIEKFHKRTDPRGNLYYWLAGELERLDDAGDTDVQAVEDGFVSITPIQLDLTDYRHLEDVAAMDWGDFTAP